MKESNLSAGDGKQQTSSPDGWRPFEFKSPSALLRALEDAFRVSGEIAVDLQLRYSYEGLVANRRFSDVAVKNQMKLADLRYPVEWYPATRTIQRSIHLHVGPTNSGKTYQALKRLEQAESGVYAGPLRLLAHEVYQRLNAKGKTCDLVTGDEIITRNAPSDGPGLRSCTVEMIPLKTTFDVAVIDEIQMMGHPQRGWAWTQALLGLQAREVHLCGEERTVPLVRELVASMGDTLEIHTYQRLSPLKTASTSLRSDLQNLRKGDCVVVFSRIGLHAMKQDIERATQKRVAIIYGGLPPEIRAQQAKLFNDPDSDYEVLVASDAIGMGLNLWVLSHAFNSQTNAYSRSIKRIIFSEVQKFNGALNEVLKSHEIKQIAGRAGRFRTAAQDSLESTHASTDSLPVLPSPNVGMVTCFEDADLRILRRAMQAKEEPIMSAGILPPTSILTQFAAFFPPSTNFSYILLRLHEIALIHPRFNLSVLDAQVKIADAIQPVENLCALDRIVFCNSPADLKKTGMATIVAALARCVGDRTSGALLDIPDIPIEALDEDIKMDRKYLDRLEMLHSSLVLYLWLSYRFAGVFINQAMAFYVKSLVEERIEKILSEYSASAEIRAKIKKMREKATRQLQEMELRSADENLVDENDEGTADQLSVKDELGGEDGNSQVFPQVSISDSPDPQKLPSPAN